MSCLVQPVQLGTGISAFLGSGRGRAGELCWQLWGLPWGGLWKHTAWKASRDWVWEGFLEEAASRMRRGVQKVVKETEGGEEGMESLWDSERRGGDTLGVHVAPVARAGSHQEGGGTWGSVPRGGPACWGDGPPCTPATGGRPPVVGLGCCLEF